MPKLVVLFVLAVATAATSAQGIPDAIQLDTASIIPEGLEFYDGAFIVGSVATNNVYTVAANGTTAVLATTSGGTNSIGVEVSGDVAFVAVANFFGAIPNVVGGFGKLDLGAGTASFVEVGEMLNDLTVDDAGNVYGTAAFNQSIYKMTPAGVASRFLDDAQFAPIPDPAINPFNIGLNGIDWNPDGFLVAAQWGNATTGKLWKVDVAAQEFVEVQKADGIDLTTLDGLYFGDANTLFSVSGAGITRMQSFDQWATIHAFDTVDLSDHCNMASASTGVYVPGEGFFYLCTVLQPSAYKPWILKAFGVTPASPSPSPSPSPSESGASVLSLSAALVLLAAMRAVV